MITSINTTKTASYALMAALVGSAVIALAPATAQAQGYTERYVTYVKKPVKHYTRSYHHKHYHSHAYTKRTYKKRSWTPRKYRDPNCNW